MKRILSLMLSAAMIFGLFGGVTASAESTQKLYWSISGLVLDHTSVSFSLDGVSVAQEAVFYIGSQEGEELVRCPFSIGSGSSYHLEYPDGISLPAGDYKVWIVNQEGASTNPQSKAIPQHSFFPSKVNAYPGSLTGCDAGDKIPRIYVKLGSETYEAEKEGGEEGKFVITYPVQEPGTKIKLYLEDDYGCQKVQEYVVENKVMNMPQVKVCRERIVMDLRKLNSDERVCIDINGKEYRSEYGAGDPGKQNCSIVTYPAIPEEIKTVPVWLESSTGSRTEKKEYEIQACDLSACKIDYVAYAKKAVGTVSADELGQLPVSVSIVIGDREYAAEIAQDGSFTLEYPYQKQTDRLKLIFRDAHGCPVQVEKGVINNLFHLKVSHQMTLIEYMVAESVPEGAKVYVSIDGQEYTSEVATKANGGVVTVRYPRQKPGTQITAWLQDDATTAVSDEKTILTIQDKEYYYNYVAETNRIVGDIHLGGTIGQKVQNNVKSVYVVIDGTTYPCTFSKLPAPVYDDEDDEAEREKDPDEEEKIIFRFTGSYPLQKIGKTIQLHFEDADGYERVEDIKLENFKPSIRIDTLYSGDNKISGKTWPGCAVSIKYGKKTYKTKSSKYGKFSARVKAQPKGTKIKVSIVSPQGYTNTKTARTKPSDSTVEISSDVYRTSSSVAITVRKPREGDKVIVKAAGKTYTKKIKTNGSKKKIVIKLKKKLATGANISVVLKDRFGKKKYSDRTSAYHGNTISLGMSAKDVVNTTWGPPVRRNDWGTGALQWIFESGYTRLYVYIRGGKVVMIQKVNY